MARGLKAQLALAAMLLAMFMAVGCGVKTRPVPSSSVAPKKVADIKARTLSDGVEVTFSVPGAPKPAQAVREVRLFYGYLPLSGSPDCPPCPPILRKSHNFALKGSEKELMDGGPFKYLDKSAPMNKEAFYRVVLEDFGGRDSVPSDLARAPRVSLPAPPAGLKVAAGENKMSLSWQGPTAPEGLNPAQGQLAFAGYVVWRKGPDGVRQLNERPLRVPLLVDRTVVPGAPYAYQVASIKQVGKSVIQSMPSPWVGASTTDVTAPGEASDLMAASQPQGLFLRFTPSPDLDVKGYMLFRREKVDGQWVQIGEELLVENVYIDKDVKPMQVYYYHVVAVDESGNKSEMSEVLEVRHQP